ncbi:MAG: 4-(cytidine 5'-diphospho)-2-C-methyl-D-erythritol kinase [Arachnia sp.]
MTHAVRVRVPAKVNLALRVGAADPQGYHALGTVFQAVSLGDDVQAELAPPGEFSMSVQGEGSAFLPTDDTNLAIRAARLLARHGGRDDVGVRLAVRKRIPVAGGMAGGSADAAAALVACSALWGMGATREDLHPLAAELGSDVPFMLLGGTAIGTGRGEQLTSLITSGTYHWTFALSHTGLSTPAVFQEFDRLSAPKPTDIPDELLEALRAGDPAAVGAALTNDLEEAALSLQPGLAHTLRIGREAGALGAVVSGSGPTVAFLAASAAHGAELAETLGLFSGVRAVRRAYGPVAGAQVIA